MTAQAGTDFLLKLGNSNAEAVSVAGLRATQMRLNNELIDATHKGSEGRRELLSKAGIQHLSISASGIFLNSDVEESIRNIAFERDIAEFSLFFPNKDVINGKFYITHYERAGDYNGEETYSLSLESSGKLACTKAEV